MFNERSIWSPPVGKATGRLVPSFTSLTCLCKSRRKYATNGAAGMIAKLKTTAFGKAIYRLTRSRLGAPLQVLSKAAQHEALQLEHLQSAHRSHNQKQIDILSRFETGIPTVAERDT